MTMDLLAIHHKALLVPIRLTIPKFLAMYKTAKKLPSHPPPTFNCNFQNTINKINRVNNNPSPPPPPPTANKALVLYEEPVEEEKFDKDKEMLIALINVKGEVAFGGCTILCQLIHIM